MTPPPETPHLVATDLITGNFVQNYGYFAYRSKGTSDWLLIYTISGKGRFGWIGGEIIAAPGDWVLLRPGTVHDYGVEQTLQHWELLWAHFNPRPLWMDLLAWPAVAAEAPGLMRLRLPEDDAPRIVQRFLDVNRLANGPQRNRSSLAMNALEDVLLWCDEYNPQRSDRIDARIRAAMDAMCQRLAEPLSVPVLADVAGLSESRFSHLFRETVGTTPQQYLEARRIDRARQLLEMTAMPIKSIAMAVGFESPFYLTRRFTRFLKCSPSEYREKVSRK